MTGGRIKRIRDYVANDDVFALTYGDGVADIDLDRRTRLPSRARKARHGDRRASRDALWRDRSRRRYASRPSTKSPTTESDWINGGFFILSPKVGDLIEGDATVWERGPMKRLARARRVARLSATPASGIRWIRLRDKLFLEEQWAAGQAKWRVLVISSAFWNGTRVFVTGHTGFKGAWLSLMLSRLNAQRHRLLRSRRRPRRISFDSATVGALIDDRRGDIARSRSPCAAPWRAAEPEIVIHMAAQPLVSWVYAIRSRPIATNVMGTVNVLEAGAQRFERAQSRHRHHRQMLRESRLALGLSRDRPRSAATTPIPTARPAPNSSRAAYRASFFGRRAGRAHASRRAPAT